jgi:TctA family transporter
LPLGPQPEETVRRAMMLSDGDSSVFVTRPISALLLAMAATILIVMLSPAILKKREEIVDAEK